MERFVRLLMMLPDSVLPTTILIVGRGHRFSKVGRCCFGGRFYRNATQFYNENAENPYENNN
uniref:Uncharacterized protein n=1 Tax=Romanomermis culicivorax TaxID=13658 RepID=A0A915HUS8_ROMCU